MKAIQYLALIRGINVGGNNLLCVIPPMTASQVLAENGELKPGIEYAAPGLGVIYQGMSWKDFGKTTFGKLASRPIYKHVTIRNYNTSVKLLKLMDEPVD